MFLKFAAVILAFVVLAASVLALRQSRLQEAHALARAQLRVREADERLWKLRAQIAELVTPERVGVMLADAGDFQPYLVPAAAPTGPQPIAPLRPVPRRDTLAQTPDDADRSTTGSAPDATKPRLAR